MEFTVDPSHESENFVMTGVQHKYPETLVVLTTNKCFKYCGHCFRKRNFDKHDEICFDYDKLGQYIKDHKEITNVLLSGGDPLTLPESGLRNLCQHVDVNDVVIRIGTRALTYDPERLYLFWRLFQAYNVHVVAHINRIDELSSNSSDTIEMLVSNGITIRSQTVLLRGVNDDVETLTELFQGLVKLNIFPYYLFQCRPTVENEKFVVPLLEGISTVNEARKKLSGLEKSFRFILSTSEGKVEVLGTTSKGDLVYRYHQSKHPELVNKVYTDQISCESVWIGG